ncbi:flagellar assembly peptidoglycan hydrolase FlgJ [Pseudomonas auratipiscis]|uniref:Peptidoglycan hydrolase FlgJ n=1 Tax=Pseudomonas auratipiscis TaxID=3115853 RepID=A0AB35WSS0_9PSED|nr:MULTISPECIES: flagellar assembly peptidoglycan hydrolase FlgJ [unclassified Pseudomonas]MEE1866427.1 flagellar assembly peptidoglycan hydrolase FlgJ [Pseudomonas sp. 120P]MEE1960158.1 flagellar assembly peptidoglycan hydrolase FlgJ [Pseudomonas sp. 119P]
MDMPKSALASMSDSGAYTDLNRLNSLKVGDRDSEANLRKVAQEFESLFLNEMLKSMRSASDVIAKDNPLNTETTKQYQQMYDQQLAVSMSREGGGIGLQDVLMRQLAKQKVASVNNSPFPRFDVQPRALGATAVGVAERSAEAGTRNDVAALNSRRLALPGKLTDRLLAGLVPSAGTAPATTNTAPIPGRSAVVGDALVKGDWQPARAFAAPSELRIYGRAVAQPPLAPAKRAFSSSDDFVATMLPMAEQAAKRIGIDPRYLVAQAALETGWGKSVMRQSDGSSSHNLFGIKATGNWQGGEARAITSEFRDGQFVKETAAFRSYDSYQDSFHDLVSLLQNNSRYKDAVGAADNPEQFAKELQKAGYATDPDYARKIISIARQLQPTPQYALAGGTTNL